MRLLVRSSLLTLIASSLAFAQGSAVLTGTVTDAATKQPIPDVVVTATSPNLQGEQIVVTDSSGLYRIPQLPPGTYTVRLEKEAYKPYSRGDIQVRVDRTIRVNIELLPEAIQAPEVVVVGSAPTIDVSSTSTGVSITQDFVKNLAVVRPGSKAGASRSFESLAEVAPGANADAFGVSVNGTTSPENQFVIDGVSVNDPGYGILGTPLTIDFIQEVNVITGGYMPEYGRATGGIMNVVTKSGSNEFHGSVFGNWSPGVLSAEPKQTRRSGSVFSTTTRDWNIGDFGAEIGGPILKDKLWFYAGFAPSFTRYQLTRQTRAVRLDASGNSTTDEDGVTVTDEIPGTQKQWFADARTFQYIGKLTYLLSSDHSVTLSIYGTPTTSGGVGKFGIGDPVAGGVATGNVEGAANLQVNGTQEAIAHRFDSGANDVALKLSSGFMDKHVLLDVTLGWHHEQNSVLPPDGSRPGSTEGGASVPALTFRRNNPTFHTLLDFENIPDPSLCEPAGTGRRGIRNLPAGVTQVTPYDPKYTRGDPQFSATYKPSVKKCPLTGYATGGTGFIREAIMDRYQAKATGTYLFSAIGHHVAKAGVDVELLNYRDDKAYTGGYWLREGTSGTSETTGGTFFDVRQYGYLQGPNDAVQIAVQSANSNSVTTGGFVQDSWNVADLLTINAGLRYDTQQVYGQEGLGVSLNNQWSPRVGLVYDFTQQGRSKIFANYARFYEGMPLDIADRSFPSEAQMGHNRRRLPDRASGAPGCDPIANPNAPKNECLDERNYLAVDGAPAPTTNTITTGTGETLLVDPEIKPQSSDEIVIGGEYEVVADSRAGLSYTRRSMNDVIEDMSRDEASSYFLGNPGSGIAADFPKAVRDYDAVTAYFTKSFSNSWLAQASYTYSYLRGNYSGLFRPETGQLDPNINSDFDLISLLDNRFGPLPGDRTHNIKLFAAKEFVLTNALALNLGASYSGRSGTPLNYLAGHPVYGADEVFVLPRGAGGRLPWRHNIDARVGVTYKITKDNAVTVGVDFFNLFNFQGVIGQDQRFTSSDLVPYNVDPNSKLSAQEQICITSSDNCTTPLKHTDGSEFEASEINPNFKNVTAYQPPRSIRFGAKVTF